ncbi:MAG: aminopeptidase P family protein [Candidatus Aenigmarchaeota archaeon]|nr:aminopeptidase P family protein [Candidatus Aenigmarchaeota archaeon]
MKAIGNVEKAFEILEKFKLDGILLISRENLIDPNIRYFTNFAQEEGLGNCILIISKAGRKLIVKEDEETRGIDAEKIIRVKHFDINTWKKVIGKIKRVGVNYHCLSLKTGSFLVKKLKLKLLDVSYELRKIRSVKTKKEIKIIREACKRTNKIIDIFEKKIVPRIKDGKITEWEVSSEIESLIRKMRANPAFKVLVVSGKRSKQIHTNPPSSFRKVKKFGYIDFGIRYKGYCTDVTVPFVLRRLNKKEERMIEILLRTYEYVLNNLRPGMLDYEVFDLANNYLRKFGLKLKHGLGHGIGLEVHENPSFLPKNSRRKIDKVENNMVFTIEPGIYLKNFGLRIEDNFIVKGEKILPLTNSHFIIS